jgi:hypothetical protein
MSRANARDERSQCDLEGDAALCGETHVKLHTTIPDELHLDLEAPGELRITVATDAAIQCQMIRTHREMMILSLRREVTMNDASVDWIEKGFAELYRKHYVVDARKTRAQN